MRRQALHCRTEGAAFRRNPLNTSIGEKFDEIEIVSPGEQSKEPPVSLFNATTQFSRVFLPTADLACADRNGATTQNGLAIAKPFLVQILSRSEPGRRTN